MSECEKYSEVASAYLDGELSDAQKDELKKHLDSCPECRAMLDEWCAAVEATRDIPEPQGPQWEAVWAHVESAAARRQASLRLRREVWRAVSVAAVAAAVLVAAYIYVPGGSTTAPLQPQPRSVIVSVEVAPDYTFVVDEGSENEGPIVWVQRI